MKIFIDYSVVENIRKIEEILKYEAGRKGPAEADRLLERGGHEWVLAEEIEE